MFFRTNRMQAAEIELDLQTHTSEASNASSVWMWHKSFSAVPETFHTQTKKVTDSAKNGTLCSSLRAATTNLVGRSETESKLIDESTDYSGFRGGGFPRQRQPLSRTVRVGGDERMWAVEQDKRLDAASIVLLLQLQCHLHGNARPEWVASQSNRATGMNRLHCLHKTSSSIR